MLLSILSTLMWSFSLSTSSKAAEHISLTFFTSFDKIETPFIVTLSAYHRVVSNEYYVEENQEPSLLSLNCSRYMLLNSLCFVEFSLYGTYLYGQESEEELLPVYSQYFVCEKEIDETKVCIVSNYFNFLGNDLLLNYVSGNKILPFVCTLFHFYL